MKNLFLFLFLIFMPVISYSVSSGTFTVNQWGTGNYTSLSSAEAGLQGVLISTCYIVITGSWTVSDSAVAFSGWTTFSTAPIIVQATGLSRHLGIWNNSCYRISSSIDYGGSIFLGATSRNIIIDGVQLQQLSPVYSYDIRDDSLQTDRTRIISNCILTGSTYYQNMYAYYDNGSGRCHIKIYNNIIYSVQNGLRCVATVANSTVTIYNNTISSCLVRGIDLYSSWQLAGGSLHLKNNLIQAGTCYYLDWSGTGSNAQSNNVSSDESGTSGYRNQISSFVASQDNNYHLLANDTTAYTKGVNLSNDGVLSFNTDIDGQTRPTDWSIGADDIPVVSTRKRKAIINFFQ